MHAISCFLDFCEGQPVSNLQGVKPKSFHKTALLHPHSLPLKIFEGYGLRIMLGVAGKVVKHDVYVNSSRQQALREDARF